MRLAVSNIAWREEEDEAVAEVLRANGVEGLEIAPTRLFAEPLQSSRDERRRERDRWQRLGLPIVAAQSLLFARPTLRLFGPDEETREMLRYLEELCGFCADLGAGPLVFGAPAARRRGALPQDQAFAIAVDFFRALGRRAAEEGVCVCIEPNPPAYGCDFVTTSDEGAALVAAVDSPGCALHLDAAALVLAGEDPQLAVTRHSKRLRHLHLSAPGLEPPTPAALDYGALTNTLAANGYAGWCSLEMRAATPGTNAARVRDAVAVVRGATAP